MHDLPLITTIAAGFAAAWVFGLITQRLGLSPIVGYLIGGVVIGPYTPGYVGDIAIANQLAEVGVILLMFGVGLHFHLKDLLAVKGIAVPGAIGQSVVATALATVVFLWFGWSIKSGVILGMAMSVASTVVLLRVLMDQDMLSSVHGHVAVGWLIVEDIITVLVLVLVPVLGSSVGAGVAEATPPAATAGETGVGGLASILWAVAKLAALVVIVLLAGSRIVPWVLAQVAKLRSRELFTLTVLVMSITVAVASASIFGASVALGAFLAGMVVGQSPVSHQAAADALPMRDAFAVLFFVAVGMLFDPSFLAQQPLMVAAGLAIVLLAKPLAALAIVATLGYSARTALTVAIGLAQIGEFSFIVAQVARGHGLMPEDGYNLLVAVAIISITLNPLLFRQIDRIERWAQNRPGLWRVLNTRVERKMRGINDSQRAAILAGVEAGAGTETGATGGGKPLAVIVGYGPVGRVVDALLRDSGMETVIIDINMDAVQALTDGGRKAIFGDATRPDILESAGIRHAVHLVVTLPHSSNRMPLVLAARDLNPKLEITVRARYLREREDLEHAGATWMAFEEGEAGIALARHVMQRRGVNDATIEKMLTALRRIWGLDA